VNIPEENLGQGLPPGGKAILPTDGLSAFRVEANTSLAEWEEVAVTGQPFQRAYRLTTKSRPENPWGVQFSATATEGVTKGDTLLLTFYVRTVKGQAETGEARTAVVFERGEDPYSKSLDAAVSIPAQGWKRFDFPFNAQEDLPQNLARVHFRLGYDPQSFEVGGISLTKWGPEVALKDLPRTKLTYTGIEEDAPWRKEAEARIEKIRKGNLTIRVLDAQDKPVKDATVSVRMKKHEFPFGTAVAAESLLRDDPDAKKYQQTIVENYNWVVMENDLKWPGWEEDKNRAIKGVDWLRQRGIAVRGHNLVWPSWQWLPSDLPALKNDKVKMANRVDTHIKDITKTMKGKLVEWDVINEPYANHDIMDTLGREAMVSWFKLAKATDPKPVLYLNDYPPLDGADTTNPHLTDFYNTIGYLKEKGAPIEGIGFQCHFGGNVIPPARLLTGLDRFGKFGLPIMITEFDVNTQDEELQAAYMRDFLTACFSHSACKGVIMWGFWEGRHWLPDAALYRRDWSIKPNGQMWLDMVKKKWWTNADGKTDGNGKFSTRGFAGEYEVTVTHGNSTAKMTFPLSTAGSTVTIKIK
jgi:GH35 family endo-1,4-beta-xylanase